MATNLCLEVIDNNTFKVNEIESAGATDLVTLWGTNNTMPAGPTPTATTGEFEVLDTTFNATGTAGQYSTNSAIPAYVEPPSPSFSGLQLPFLIEYDKSGTVNIDVSPDTAVSSLLNHLSVKVREEGGNEIELTRTIGEGPNMASLLFENEELGVYLSIYDWSKDGVVLDDDTSQVCDWFKFSYDNTESPNQINYELVSFDWI